MFYVFLMYEMLKIKMKLNSCKNISDEYDIKNK